MRGDEILVVLYIVYCRLTTSLKFDFVFPVAREVRHQLSRTPWRSRRESSSGRHRSEAARIAPQHRPPAREIALQEQ